MCFSAVGLFSLAQFVVELVMAGPDAVLRFARECQMAADACVPPTDSLRVLSATWSALRSYPEGLPELASAKAARALVSLARHVVDEHCGRSTSMDHERRLRRTRRQTVVAALDLIILRHTLSKLTLADIGTELGVSRSHLSRTLRDVSGYGFPAHLSGLRVLTAVTRLEMSDASLRDLAVECGYHHTGELDRDFSKWVRTAPGQFRALLAG